MRSNFSVHVAAAVHLMCYGIIYHTTAWGKALIVIGAVVALTAVIGWAMEPVEEPHDEPGEERTEEVEASV